MRCSAIKVGDFWSWFLRNELIGLIALIWSAAIGIVLSWDLVLARSELSRAGWRPRVDDRWKCPGASAAPLLPASAIDSEATRLPAPDGILQLIALVRRGLAAVVEPLNLLRSAPLQVAKAFGAIVLDALGQHDLLSCS